MNVSVGATVAVDVRLEVGGLTEKVEVVAVQETIDTRTGEFRTTVSGRQLAELPTLTRNPYDLVALSGNVEEASSDEGALVGGEQGGRGTGFSINGAHSQHQHPAGRRRQQLSVHLGHRPGNPARRGAGVLGHHQQLLAQCGRASGGIVNVVIKSGTKPLQRHGHEFFRNDELSSNSPDNEARDLEKGNFRRNQLGYSFGGPIVRDKVHFFSSLEYIGIRSTDTQINWVVTPEFVNAISGNARNYFNAYGVGAVSTGRS